MPTILEKDGFRIIIRTRDHNPPHVHIYKADGQIKIALGSETEPIEIVDSWMHRSDARKAVAIVEENRMHLLAKWREIYG
jgi:hypothetical protein